MDNNEVISILRKYQYGGEILPPHSFDLNTETVEFIIAALERDKVPAIPIVVIERAIEGISAADQCDQAGRSDYIRRAALKECLWWYNAPCYQWDLDVCRSNGMLPKAGEPWVKKEPQS